MIVNKLTSQKDKSSSSSSLNSPFECGFTNYLKNNVPAANNFFIFSILFLILELEIILIIPFTSLNLKSDINNYSFFLIIITILVIIVIE